MPKGREIKKKKQIPSQILVKFNIRLDEKLNACTQRVHLYILNYIYIKYKIIHIIIYKNIIYNIKL